MRAIFALRELFEFFRTCKDARLFGSLILRQPPDLGLSPLRWLESDVMSKSLESRVKGLVSS